MLYEVSQILVGPGPSMSANWLFEIKVPSHLCEQAHLLLDEDPDEHFELPADPRLIELDDAAKRAYLRKFHPEDAVVEVFSENPENYSSAVRLSLQTNLIHFRAEVLHDGSVRLFVLPEDRIACARDCQGDKRRQTTRVNRSAQTASVAFLSESIRAPIHLPNSSNICVKIPVRTPPCHRNHQKNPTLSARN